MHVPKTLNYGNIAHGNALRAPLTTAFRSRMPAMRSLAISAAAEPESPADEESTSGRTEGLMDRPKRPPPKITSAPPTPRTREAKERALAQRAADRNGGNRNNDSNSGERRPQGQFQRPRIGGPPGGGGNPNWRPRNTSGGGAVGGNNGANAGRGGYNNNNNNATAGRSQNQASSGGGTATGPPRNGGNSRFSRGPNTGGNVGGGRTFGGYSNAGGGGGGGGGGNGRGGQQSKGNNNRSERRPKRTIDVGSRRKARQSRRAERQEEARAAAPQREDIFEVGLEGMSVMDLAEMLAVPPVEIVKKLFLKGLAVQVNSTLDAETVKAVGVEYGVDVLDRDESRVEDWARKSREFIDEGDLDFLQIRPPVVTVMGHVDHGKTSLLDFVRKSKVAAGEAGGITQSIGAYTCDVEYGGEMRQVTFLDTPGHEAFSAMRARGARVTDIAIVIVAADDGVRPQTLEAVSHARAAGVPIVVAINKCDKEGANPERVKQQLTEVELIPEEWGGKTPMVQISAKKGQGVDDLLETVLLVAELEELQARPDRAAVGTVLEAALDKKSGPVTTVLVQNGTLRVGDALVAGASYGKVRSMRTTLGEVDAAGPSHAVQVFGLNSVPLAGDELEVFESESRAREAAEAVEDARRLERLAEMAGGGAMVTLSTLASMDDDNEEQALQRMNVILKADASGSCEAVKSALGALPQDTVVLRYLLAAPGEITVSDIDLATASGGMVLGFGVRPSETVIAAAKQAGVTVSAYDVIYDLIDDVRAAMEGRLRLAQERVDIGEAEVKAVFGSGNRKVAGCVVTDGVLRKGALVTVKRGKRVVYEGQLTSLRRVKDDVKEVTAGTECGLGLEGFREWEEGDRILACEVVEKKLKLEEAHATTVELSSSGGV